MAKVLNKKYLILGILLGVFLLVILLTSGFAIKTQTKNLDNWEIRSFEDTVVLLNNGDVVEVFGDISIESLPQEDKRHLEKGISFLSKDEALLALEDYDG